MENNQVKLKFDNLTIGDNIYILVPGEKVDIRPLQITKTGIPKMRLDFKYFSFIKMLKNDKIANSSMLQAKKEHDTPIEDTIMVERKAHLVLLNTLPPTVCSTKREYIEEWISKAY